MCTSTMQVIINSLGDLIVRPLPLEQRLHFVSLCEALLLCAHIQFQARPHALLSTAAAALTSESVSD